ncbi:hypothetical protein [Rubricoccus marinus]|uniref:Nitroreductase domain-containing protein n=1 Tax=Rubricoccus marinus TaxID=716817 RepID=A0A259TVS8_9BACT|nr:hypothetical protein [Rubricoccus marinus]OZC01872.1 hypothetical protein BSZ36_02030 [Rubricoccus marinus]
MFRLDPHLPHAPAAPAAFLDAALQQAARDADAVPGAYARAPWGFRPATPAAKRILDDFEGRSRSWIVVTCRRSDAQEHTRERCLTAIQRYLLSLAVEGVDATWIGSGLPEGLEDVSEMLPREEILGVVRLDSA